MKIQVLTIAMLTTVLGHVAYYGYRDKYPADAIEEAVVRVSEGSPFYRDWDVLFTTLKGVTYLCDAENIEVKVVTWESKEPGTYASFLNLQRIGLMYDQFRAGKILLYVTTPEEEAAWNKYLSQMKELKTIRTSPRSVFPPG